MSGRGELAAWLAALVLASAGLWRSLAAAPLLATNDGPEHIMMGYIENHYEDEGTVYRHFLAPAPQYAGRGFAALFVPLEPVLGWRGAYRATVFALLLAWSWGFALLVHALEPRRRWLGLLGFATAFQWTVYMGFFAFVAGSACGLWVLALAAATRQWTARRLVALGLALLLQGFLHVFSALLTGAVLLLVVLQRGPARARLVAAARLALAALPLLLLFAATLRDQPAAAHIPHAEKTWFVPLLDKLGYLHRAFQPGADWRGLVVLALALLGLARGLLRWRGRAAPVEQGFAAASVVLLLAAALGPEALPGWQFFWQRFLPLALVLPLLLLDVERLPARARAATALALAVYTGASQAAAASLTRKLYERNADVYSGLEQPIVRHGLRLPVSRDPWFALPPARSPVPGMVPLHAVGGLFVAAQGGMIPYMFIDSPSVHEFVGRDAAWAADFPPRPPPDKLQRLAHLRPSDPERLRALDELAAEGAGYEDVMLVSAPADAEAFRRRGYVTDYERGDLYLAHYRGCDVEVALAAGARPRAIEYGFWPRTDARRRLALDGGASPGEGGGRVKLPGAPCGRMWIRPLPDAAGCAGADAEGRIVVEAGAGTTTVSCDANAR